MALVIIMALGGCETLKIADDAVKTTEAHRLLKKSGANYVPNESGFCSQEPIPEEDQWILNCKYGMSCPE